MKSIQSVLLVATLILGLGGCLNSAKSMFQKTLTRAEDGDAKSQWYLGVMYETGTEVSKDYNYMEAMRRTHKSIGYAMYYTSITIIVGFSILVFSNFIPSIYFGLLTGLAMFLALLASLTLLPQLLIYIKPYGTSSKDF